MKVHFINVGQGNMTLIQIPNNKTIIYDCNITKDNEEDVLGYLGKHINKVDIFINSHRDADHMRGVTKIYNQFGIDEIWDSGVPGTTTDSTEYIQYMNLRRKIGKEVESKKFRIFGDCKLRIMNSKNSDFVDANEQSLVVKLEYKNHGVMLPGDTSYKSWKDFIEQEYSASDLSSSILLASHHGSLSFFDDPSDVNHYYTSHIKKIAPAMTIVSVGDNDTHPHEKALKLYENHSSGSNKGNKVHMTKDKGHMALILKEGNWTLSTNQ